MAGERAGEHDQAQAFGDLFAGTEHVSGDATDLALRQPSDRCGGDQRGGDQRGGDQRRRPPADGDHGDGDTGGQAGDARPA